MIGWWYALNTLLTVALSSTAPITSEATTNVCEITHHPAQYLGRKVVVDALLVNASPHGIYVREMENSHCILDIGSMAAGEKDDVLGYFFIPDRKPNPFVREAKVRIHAVLKSGMKRNPFTGDDPQYRYYFLDQMKISRLEP